MKKAKELLWRFVKFWWKAESIACIALLVCIAGLIVSFVGVPKKIEEPVTACVYTESGETLSCEIRLEGEVTTYPFRKVRDYTIGAYRENIRIAEFSYNTLKYQYVYDPTYRSTGIKAVSQDVMVVEMDLHTLFPEQESQRCILTAPALEKSDVIEMLRDDAIYEEYRKNFDWFLNSINAEP